MHRHSSIQLALGIIAASLLSACQTDKPAPVIDVAPLSSQIGALAQANADLRAANERLIAANVALQTENERLKSQLRSDADAGLAANEKGWLPFEGYVWRQQIARLPSVQPDASTVSKWTEAAGLYADGGESAMQGVIADLKTDATTQAKKLGELDASIKQLTKERDAAQEAAELAQKAVQDAEDALTAAVEKARQDEAARIARETREWQIHAANWIGGGLFVAALGLAACCFLLPVASTIFKKSAFVAGIGCAACFALARFLSSPWFDYAWKITAGTLVVAGIAWAAWEIRSAIRRREAEKVADDNELTVKPIISTLDTAYDEADIEHQAWMDAQIFEVLGKQGPQYSAAIHEIKASIALDKKKTSDTVSA